MTDGKPSASFKNAGSIVADTLGNVSTLVRKEVDLARTEINENVARAGLAIGLLVGAVVVALVSLNVLAAALVTAITEFGLDAGLSALLVGVGLAIIAFALLSKGMSDLKLSSLAPTRTVKNVQRDAHAVKEAYNDE